MVATTPAASTWTLLRLSKHDTFEYVDGNCDAYLSNSTVYSMLATCDTTPGGQPKDCHDAASARQHISHCQQVPLVPLLHHAERDIPNHHAAKTCRFQRVLFPR